MVLRPESAVEDLARGTELMGSGVDQRLVLKVLVPVTVHGIDAQERALEMTAHTTGERGALEIIHHAWLVLMIHGVAPEGVLVVETIFQQLHHAVVKIASAATLGLMAQTEGNEVKVGAVEVGIAQVLEHVGLSAVLRDPVPGGFVLLTEFIDYAKSKLLRGRNVALGVGHLHGIDCKLAGAREVEVVVKGGGGVRLQLHRTALGVKAVL